VIVVDSSLIGAFILKEEGWEDYAGTLENALTVDHAIKEVGNAIWKAYIRKHIGLEDVKIKFEALKKLFSKNLTMFPEMELLEGAMDIALSHKIPIYDSLYLALALIKGASFSSLDETQLSIARKLGVPIIQAATPKREMKP